MPPDAVRVCETAVNTVALGSEVVVIDGADGF
jgi:hypothetical protein